MTAPDEPEIHDPGPLHPAAVAPDHEGNFVQEADPGADDLDEPDLVDGAPDRVLCWPVADRDPFAVGRFEGTYFPGTRLGSLLQMDGLAGRDEAAILQTTGEAITRPRRLVKVLERVGIFHPGRGNTRLGRLGRLLRDAARPGGMRLWIGREAVQTLWRYQFDNPVERALPDGCSIHPYWATLRAAFELDGKIHWDEVNRELMGLLQDDEVTPRIERIRIARAAPGYERFIGGEFDGAGLLDARAHPARETTAAGHNSVGQLRDQRITPFMKRAGFGELLLEAPRNNGGGYWRIPDDMRTVLNEALQKPPEAKHFLTVEAWADWFTEGIEQPLGAPLLLEEDPPKLQCSVTELTLILLKAALERYDVDLKFSDALLASVVAALRAGDGKHFIILRGISGTGKSRLVAAIAKALYNLPEVPEPWLTMIEVRPDWTDASPLLGHYATVEARYVRRKFLDALICARDNEDYPVVVCLDEMNLSHVEYYLAEALSAMESGLEIPIDRRSDHSVAGGIRWPKNLCLFGTINNDETTKNISDKVLDRAQVIDTSEIDLEESLELWLVAANLNEADKELVRVVIMGTWIALGNVGAQFGFRTAKAIVRFVVEAKASSGGVLDVNAALDLQLRQKVLVKLRGEGDRWTEALLELEGIASKLSVNPSSAFAALGRMRSDLERYGTFQSWS